MLLANQTAEFFKIQYLKKEVNDEVYFWHPDKHDSFLLVDSIILGIQLCPKYPNNKFAISLQYLKEIVKDGVYFSPKGMPKLPKITSLIFLCNILRIK